MRLSGTTALITGASSGIGAAIAVALAAAGSRPLLMGRDEDRLARVARSTGGVPIVADLASPEGVADAAGRAFENAEHIDVLVNNAGIGWAGPLEAMSEGDVARLTDTNLVAPIYLTRRALPRMVERGGHILFVTSIAGCTGVREEAVYAATKAGLHVFAEGLRYEVAGNGVGVSVVVPGVVATPFFERRGTPYGRRRPRPVPAERVARAAVDALQHDRAEVFVPRWMRLPARLHGGMPGAFRALAARGG
ncbi:MAG: SDR family NAD(P)-dependent oxidoreductase [Streptosporangiales bacterium]|nr:SDR family NAD(P)-dependent oxidoreductase [Streptosporangiales bacterium]